MKNIVWILAILFLFGCKKNPTTSNTTPSTNDTGLSKTEIAYWESLGVDSSIKSSDLQFENGTPMSNWLRIYDSTFFSKYAKGTASGFSLAIKLNNLITTYEYAAKWLADRKNFSFPNQYGIAYVYNSKEYETPSQCSASDKCACATSLYGLECGGYIYQIFKIANLFNDCQNNSTTCSQKSNTTGYLDTKIWNDALSKSDLFNGLVLVDKGPIPFDQIKVGDIIDKPGSHIGIVLQANGYKKIFSSLGLPEYPCSVNSNVSHGPCITPKNGTIKISDMPSLFSGNSYHVLRFTDPNNNFVGANLQGPLTHYSLHGSPSYYGDIGFINLFFEIEISGDLKSIISSDFNFNTSSPNIPNYYTLGISSDNSMSTSSLSGGNVSINFGNSQCSFAGTISGNTISGTFNCNYRYVDIGSKDTTIVPLNAPISLYLQ